MLDHQTIKAAAWGDEDALAEVHAAVAKALSKVPEGNTLGATKLMVMIAEPEHFKLLSNALYRLRQTEDFAGSWSRTERKGAFGHKLIFYFGRKAAPRTIEQVRADLASCPEHAKARAGLERELQALLAKETF